MTQRGPGGRAGGRRGLLPALPSSLSHLLGHPPLLPLTGSLAGGQHLPFQDTPELGGGMRRSAPPPPTSPARGSRCTVERDWPGLDAGHTLVHTRTHEHTHAQPTRRSKGGPVWAGRRRPACCPTSRPLGPGPRAPGPPADTGRAPVSTVVKEDERVAWTGPQGPAAPGRSAHRVWSGLATPAHDGPPGSRFTGRPRAHGQRLCPADQPLPS